ncbi:MAG TPA: hypothetical protein VFU43_04030 [Streptosporangiaceae bacterium]|nr:hypothetical protein [Streptosporangiaceae bacterium]
MRANTLRSLKGELHGRDLPNTAKTLPTLASYPFADLLRFYKGRAMNGSGPRPWSFRYYAVLAALPTTPYWARALTREALRSWSLDPFTETTALLVSELAANAIKALGVTPVGGTAPPPVQPKLIALRLSASSRTVIAEVWDGDPNVPQPKTPGPDDTSGRGLLLVARMASRWGYYHPTHHVDEQSHRLWPAPGGKVTWFEVMI